MSEPSNVSDEKHPFLMKGGIFVALCVVFGIAYWQLSEVLTLEAIAEQESRLRAFQSEHPIIVFGIAFVVYAAVAGLSLPFATPLTLVYGWYFGVIPGVILVSFASTTGATLAFLMSRFLFHDALQRRFSDRFRQINQALEKEGPFYLFTLRLIPAFPFWVINLVMGLTPIKLWTYWWVSQVGMFPGTIVYVYAGSIVPNLQLLAEEDGIEAVFTPTRLTQILIAFALLGLFPLIVRTILKRFAPSNASESLIDS